MGYKLTSKATGEALRLSSGEWKMLQELAASPVGWKPQEDRDYTRGMIDPEEASKIAESVKEMLAHVSSQHAYQYPEETRQTRQELKEDLGYEEEPLRFFGNPPKRAKAEDFVRLASAGAFEIIPEVEL